jgi:hypothetical protein
LEWALMPGSKSPEVRQRMAQRQVQADELAAKVGELRLAGLSFRQVAEAIGCSTSSAAEGWKRFRRALVRGDIESERNLLLGRCEKLLRQLASKLVTGDVQAVRAATEVLRLMSDVGGYAMPTQVAVDLNARQPVTTIEFHTMPSPHWPNDPRCECEDCKRGTGGERVENGQRRLLGPAEVIEPVEVR